MESKRIEDYMYLLDGFYIKKSIADSEIRSHLNYRFSQAFKNYKSKYESVTFEKYLCKCLQMAYNTYWSERERKNRRRINPKNFTDLDKKEIGTALDSLIVADESKNYKEDDSLVFARLFISCLSWKQQELVYYIFTEELDFSEIAEKVGNTPQAIHKMWDRIVKKFNSNVIVDFSNDDSHKLLNISKV